MSVPAGRELCLKQLGLTVDGAGSVFLGLGKWRWGKGGSRKPVSLGGIAPAEATAVMLLVGIRRGVVVPVAGVGGGGVVLAAGVRSSGIMLVVGVGGGGIVLAGAGGGSVVSTAGVGGGGVVLAGVGGGGIVPAAGVRVGMGM